MDIFLEMEAMCADVCRREFWSEKGKWTGVTTREHRTVVGKNTVNWL